jgi:hypothetical protein
VKVIGVDKDGKIKLSRGPPRVVCRPVPGAGVDTATVIGTGIVAARDAADHGGPPHQGGPFVSGPA